VRPRSRIILNGFGSASESLLNTACMRSLAARVSLRLADELGRTPYRGHLTGETRKPRLPRRPHPGGANLDQSLVEAGHEPLLELRRAELSRGPSEPLGNDYSNVEGLPASRAEEVVPDAFALEEGIRAVDGALDHVGGFFGVEIPSLEPFGARRET
jgi:hypothetical protein